MYAIEILRDITQTIEFEEKEVDDKLIGVSIYLANQALSAGEMHEWEFIVIKDPVIKERVYEAALRQNWIRSAPILVVICMNEERVVNKYGEKGKKYGEQDVSFAAYSLVLAANSIGLGTYLAQAFDEDKVSEILKLPKRLKPKFIVCLGYPKIKREKSRVDIDRITWLNEYGKKYEFSYYLEPFSTKETPTTEEILRDFLKKKSIKEKIKSFFFRKH
ncbi:MAG: nitroreductase family protein [Candidatus Aenigmarchaeota archaeon]|nr:nitroreductase family protein [Candidatus Aenigmarchaeota archaeon]